MVFIPASRLYRRSAYGLGARTHESETKSSDQRSWAADRAEPMRSHRVPGRQRFSRRCIDHRPGSSTAYQAQGGLLDTVNKKPSLQNAEVTAKAREQRAKWLGSAMTRS